MIIIIVGVIIIIVGLIIIIVGLTIIIVGLIIIIVNGHDRQGLLPASDEVFAKETQPLLQGWFKLFIVIIIITVVVVRQCLFFVKVKLASRATKMIVDLPQFRCNLQKKKAQNAKDKSLAKDDNVDLEADMRPGPFEANISDINDITWRQSETCKPPSRSADQQISCKGEVGALVKILELGRARDPPNRSSSQSTPLFPTSSQPQDHPSTQEKSSKEIWPIQCASKVVASRKDNFQAATLADLFTREVPDYISAPNNSDVGTN